MSATEGRPLGHAVESDGIEEYDNPGPRWVMALFAACIAWAAGYVAHYHFVAGRSQAAEYDVEVEEAAARWPAEAAPPQLEVTPESVAAGAELFRANCTGCHGSALEGGIGPNLKDEAWIHGGTLDAIRTTIGEGVAAKGMPGWRVLLGQQKVDQLAVFVKDASAGEAGAAP